MQDIKTADWSQEVAPFWGAVIKSALSTEGFSGLFKAGWTTIKVGEICAAVLGTKVLQDPSDLQAHNRSQNGLAPDLCYTCWPAVSLQTLCAATQEYYYLLNNLHLDVTGMSFCSYSE